MTKRKFNTSLGFPNIGAPAGREYVPGVLKAKDMRGSTAPKEGQEYTGTEMLGIALMHKSCFQPVFSEQAAKDSAQMRR